MNYEERYYELREAVDRAWDEYNREPNITTNINYGVAVNEFRDFCEEVLEKLMEENSDVLARLKCE